MALKLGEAFLLAGVKTDQVAGDLAKVEGQVRASASRMQQALQLKASVISAPMAGATGLGMLRGAGGPQVLAANQFANIAAAATAGRIAAAGGGGAGMGGAAAAGGLAARLGMGGGMLATGGVALGLTALGGAAVKARNALMTQEQAEKKLAAVLDATGNVSGLTMEQLKEFASSIQKTTNYGDEMVLNSMAILATFKEIKGENFIAATRAAADMAAVMGTDLQGAMLQLGKALQEPEVGLLALRRSGVSFSEAQRTQIKALVEAGQLQKAQNIILREVQTEFGGVAQRLVEPSKQAANAIGDLWEAVGSLVKGPMDELARSARDAAIALTELAGGKRKPTKEEAERGKLPGAGEGVGEQMARARQDEQRQRRRRELTADLKKYEREAKQADADVAAARDKMHRAEKAEAGEAVAAPLTAAAEAEQYAAAKRRQAALDKYNATARALVDLQKGGEGIAVPETGEDLYARYITARSAYERTRADLEAVLGGKAPAERGPAAYAAYEAARKEYEAVKPVYEDISEKEAVAATAERRAAEEDARKTEEAGVLGDRLRALRRRRAEVEKEYIKEPVQPRAPEFTGIAEFAKMVQSRLVDQTAKQLAEKQLKANEAARDFLKSIDEDMSKTRQALEDLDKT